MSFSGIAIVIVRFSLAEAAFRRLDVCPNGEPERITERTRLGLDYGAYRYGSTRIYAPVEGCASPTETLDHDLRGLYWTTVL